MLGELAMAIASDDEDSSDEELVDALLLGACEPLVKDMRQQIGPERLSLARLQREAAAAGLDADTASRNIYKNFRFRLEELPRVVAALDPPHGFRTNSGAVFSGEEGVLMLLRRFSTSGTLLDLVWLEARLQHDADFGGGALHGRVRPQEAPAPVGREVIHSLGEQLR